MRSARYGDEMKEKSNKSRHKEYYTSDSRSYDHRQQDEYRHSRKHEGHSRSHDQVSRRKDRVREDVDWSDRGQKRNEFKDRYDPSKSHDMDEDAS